MPKNEKIYGRPVDLFPPTPFKRSYVERNKQNKPYLNPLPYQRYSHSWKHGDTPAPHLNFSFNPTYRWAYYCGKDSQSLINVNTKDGIDNKALEKVDDQLAYINNFFEDIYERQQSLALVASAAKKLLQFATNWKKPQYWKSLKTGLKTPRSYPEAWLAYNFGVKPLIGSIDTALHDLGKNFPEVHVKGTSGGTITTIGHANPDYGQQNATVKYRCLIGCRVVGNTNPNRALANIVGLTTPFSTAMSVVPWGWAVDYFVNASQLLSNFENKHPGVTTLGWYRTEVFEGQFYGTQGFPGYKPHTPYSGNAYEMIRTLQGSNYKLHLDFPLLGSGKAANLLSALAVSMKQKR